MDGLSRSDVEEAIQNHFDEFHREIARRDEWLINAIWNTVRSVITIGSMVTALAVCEITGLTEWWQVLIAILAAQVLAWRQNRKSRDLEDQDKRKIGMDSGVGKFRFW